MQLRMIGLGRMGAGMARRLMRGGHACIVYDRDAAQIFALVRDGAKGAESLQDVARKLTAPRTVSLMLPAGHVTGRVLRDTAAELLSHGDIIVDSGNSRHTDDIARGAWLAERGVWGEERGYCLMVGGRKDTVDYLEPIFATLAPGQDSVPHVADRNGHRNGAEQGYLCCGATGAGHLVKKAHNGIEYGLMQAFAEGFDLLQSASRLGYQMPVPDIAEAWRHGSVISAWLLDLAAAAVSGGPRSRRFRMACQRLRRGTLDRRSGRSGRGTVPGAEDGALRPVPIAGGPHLRRETAFRHAAWFGGHVGTPQLVTR